MNLKDYFDAAYAVNPINEKQSTKNDCFIEFQAAIANFQVTPELLMKKYIEKIEYLKRKNYTAERTGQYKSTLPTLENWLLHKGWEENVTSTEENERNIYLYGY